LIVVAVILFFGGGTPGKQHFGKMSLTPLHLLTATWIKHRHCKTTFSLAGVKTRLELEMLVK
jgi:hypothetical protein